MLADASAATLMDWLSTSETEDRAFMVLVQAMRVRCPKVSEWVIVEFGILYLMARAELLEREGVPSISLDLFYELMDA